jgi:glycosyltransferase involved in cell wall biosynthesis
MELSTSSTTPFLSVVIPCFNAMPYIEEAIGRVLEWPTELVEIIVQDGCSSDGTVEYLRSLGDRIQLSSEPDSGQSDALDRAIRRSRGKFVGWLNADDLYDASALSALLDAYSDYPDADVFFGNFALVDASGEILKSYSVSPWSRRRFIRRGCYVWSGSTFIHSRVFERYGSFQGDLHYSMDFEFFLRIADKVQAVQLDKCVGYFRQHEGAKTSGVPWRFLREKYRILDGYLPRGPRKRVPMYLHLAEQGISILFTPLRMSALWRRVRDSKLV